MSCTGTMVQHDDTTSRTSRNSLLTTMTDDDTVTDPATLEAIRNTKAVAIQALAVSVQDWKNLGQGDDPSVATPTSVDEAVDRLTALLLVRIVAMLDPTRYSDLSTSTICRTALIENKPWCPEQLTPAVVQQLRKFVKFILKSHLDLPYHNYQHAYHVVVSANKLLELMLSTSAGTMEHVRRPPAFGLRKDPLSLAALVFAALVHDTGHKGVTNRQLVAEATEQARLYNDQSVQEHHSLRLSFEELLKDCYSDLRQVMFREPEQYRYFRTLVVNAVLSTDLASPERTQISKSKWNEAFQDKVVDEGGHVHTHARGGGGGRRSSMASTASNISLHRIQVPAGRQNRRGSASSIVSDVTADSFDRWNRRQREVDELNARRQSSTGMDYPPEAVNMMEYGRTSSDNRQQKRRASNQSMHSVESEFSDFAADSVAGHGARTDRKPASGHAAMRRSSTDSMGSEFSDFAADSVMGNGGGGKLGMHLLKNAPGHSAKRRSSVTSMDSEFSDFAADSVMGNDRTGSNRKLASSNRAATDRMSPIRTKSGGSASLLSFDGGAADSIALAQKHRAAQRGGPTVMIDGTPAKFISRRSSTGGTGTMARPTDRAVHGPGFMMDDDSLSLTPPSSDDEYDGVVVSGITLSRSLDEGPLMPNPTGPRGGTSKRIMQRRASTGNVPVKFGSLTGQRIDEDEVASNQHAPTIDFVPDPEAVGNNRFRTRLSIRRSMDLTGEAIEIYSRSSSMGGISAFTDQFEDGTPDTDQPDELRAVVILELLLRTADVAHLLQDWAVMKKYVSRLFKELKMAHEAGRGHDPEPGWFDNQVKILESYMTPLANRLDEIGVFGEAGGPAFAEMVERNKDMWLVQGFDEMMKLNEKKKR